MEGNDHQGWSLGLTNKTLERESAGKIRDIRQLQLYYY